MPASGNHATRSAPPAPGREETLFSLIVRGLLLAAALIIALWFLHQVQQAVLVLAVAAIVAVFLNAPVHWLEKRGLSRGLSTAVVLVTLLVVTGLVGWLVVPRLAQEVPRLINLLPKLTRDLAEQLASAFGDSPAVERQLSLLVGGSSTRSDLYGGTPAPCSKRSCSGSWCSRWCCSCSSIRSRSSPPTFT